MVILLKFLIIGVFGVLTWLANWRRGRQTEARFSCSIAAAVLQCPELGGSGLDIDTIYINIQYIWRRHLFAPKPFLKHLLPSSAFVLSCFKIPNTGSFSKVVLSHRAVNQVFLEFS